MLFFDNYGANGKRAWRGPVNCMVDIVLVINIVAEHVGGTEAHQILEIVTADLKLLVVVSTHEATLLVLRSSFSERLLKR